MHLRALSFAFLGKSARSYVGAGRKERHRRRLYLLGAAATALVGYGWLLLFPALVVFGVSELVQGVVGFSNDWRHMVGLSGMTILSGVVSYELFRCNPVPEADYPLSREQAPALFALVDELEHAFDSPRIHCVFISEACAVQMTRAPRFGLPVLRNNALIVGLPVIQGLAPDQFKIELARHVGRLAARHSRATGWLYHLRDTWQYYRAPQGAPVFRWLFKAFFAVYAPLYERVTRRAARMDELHADEYAVEIMGAEDVSDALSAMAINRRFMAEKFWPTVDRLCDKSAHPTHLPFSALHAAFLRGLSDADRRRWLDASASEETMAHDVVPSLSERLDNIAYRSAPLPPQAEQTAAHRYLDGVLASIARALDERWVLRTADQRERRLHERGQAQKRLDRLASEAARRRLCDEELHEYARLVGAYEWRMDQPGRFQRLLDARPADAKFQLALGALLLRDGREEGVAVLERVMELDERYADEACRVIARHRGATAGERSTRAA